MTALSDDEDAPPHDRVASRELSTEPPPALEHFTEAQEAPTLPPPPVDEALAAAVAGHVVAFLGKRLDRIEDELMAVRTWTQNHEPIIKTIDRTVGKLLEHAVDASANIDRMADAIGPRREDQPPLFESFRLVEDRVASLESKLGITMPPPVMNGNGE